MTERPFPAQARWLAVGLNVLLLLVEALFLIPRWVGEDEIGMVSLTFGAAFVNLTIFIDYYRRGMVGKNRKVRAGEALLQASRKATPVGAVSLESSEHRLVNELREQLVAWKKANPSVFGQRNRIRQDKEILDHEITK